MYEISGPFFFASAKLYAEAIRRIGLNSKILIIRMRHVPFIDATGCENFISAIKDLRKQGIMIILSGVNNGVLKELDKKQISLLIGKANIFRNFSDAIQFVLTLNSQVDS